MEVYEYSVFDTKNDRVNIKQLTFEIRSDLTFVAVLSHINVNENIIQVVFNQSLTTSEETAVNTFITNHEGVSEELDETIAQPHMDDGRPIVRADTRPMGSMIFFTTTGDGGEDIGNGVSLRWDFSNDDDLYTGDEVPDGHKAKQILMKFNCPVYLKDGAIYFFDAPWGEYMEMDILVPSGGYYDNPKGQIPAYMLGLSGDTMYAQAPSGSNVVYQKYVNKHYVYKDCPMGDELNAEGCAITPVPVGWFVRGLIITPIDDNISKGFASLEMYRCHTVMLPGQDIEDLH